MHVVIYTRVMGPEVYVMELMAGNGGWGPKVETRPNFGPPELSIQLPKFFLEFSPYFFLAPRPICLYKDQYSN